MANGDDSLAAMVFPRMQYPVPGMGMPFDLTQYVQEALDRRKKLTQPQTPPGQAPPAKPTEPDPFASWRGTGSYTAPAMPPSGGPWGGAQPF